MSKQDKEKKNMQTLVCQTQPPSLLTKSISPWMKRSLSPPQHNTAIQTSVDPLHSHLPSRRRTEWQPRAKGFGEAAVTVSDGKTRREGESRNGNSGGRDDEDEIPQAVFQRIIVRILFFVGAPMALGVGLLLLLNTLKEQHVWDVPLWLPYLTVVLGFGTSALGIAYGTLSTSWDLEKKGSLLGWEEAQKNWPELWKEDEERNR